MISTAGSSGRGVPALQVETAIGAYTRVRRELGDGGVPAGAQDDPDALAVVAEPELLVDCVQVEVHLRHELRLELTDLSSMITNRRREWW